MQILSCSGASSLFYFSCKVQFVICHTEGLVKQFICLFLHSLDVTIKQSQNKCPSSPWWLVCSTTLQLKCTSCTAEESEFIYHTLLTSLSWMAVISEPVMAALACGAHEAHNAVLKGLSQVYSGFSRVNSEGACALGSGSDEIKSDSVCISFMCAFKSL